MKKVLYISLTGMTEPLGESQVVQYLLELAKKQPIYLLSFEKPVDEEKYLQMEKKLSAAGIHWKYYKYSNRFGIFSTIWQISIAVLYLNKLVRKEKIQIVHTRSLIPAVMGMLLKKTCNIKLLFDIRGFAIDEKITEGRLKEGSLLTKFLKKLEANVYKNADHVVTLTHVSKPIIENLYHVKATDITVIPTCADSDLFFVLPEEKKEAIRKEIGFLKTDFVLLHIGSLNSWIDFEAEIKLIRELIRIDDQIKILFLNKGQHDLIFSYLEKYQIQKDNYKILDIEFNQVTNYLNAANLCLFFVTPCPAKQASAPTKFAEIVACHLYSITNTKYGDLEYYMNSYPVGALLDLNEIYSDTPKIARQVLEFIARSKHENHSKDFNELFEKHFSKEIGVNRYQTIYDSLAI